MATAKYSWGMPCQSGTVRTSRRFTGLSAGPIIGIIIAILVVAALVAFGATVFARKMKRGARRNQSVRNGAGVVGDVML